MTCSVRSFCFIAVAMMAVLIRSDQSRGQTEAAEIAVIADQIRSQGFICTNPSSAKRVGTESSPDEPVYVLVCDNATYQVRLVPDQAATVVQVK
jgi:hypothetical protein